MADFEQAGATERLRRVAILRDMQAKLKRSAAEALGVEAGASTVEIRSAFMSLTKQYHPAKFARLDEPTVRLANEVFLQLREAYESLSAAAGGRRARTVPGLGGHLPAPAEEGRPPEGARKSEARPDVRSADAVRRAPTLSDGVAGRAPAEGAGRPPAEGAGGPNRTPASSRPAIEGVAAGRVPASAAVISRSPAGAPSLSPRRTPPGASATNATRPPLGSGVSSGSGAATSRPPLHGSVVSSTGRPPPAVPMNIGSAGSSSPNANRPLSPRTPVDTIEASAPKRPPPGSAASASASISTSASTSVSGSTSGSASDSAGSSANASGRPGSPSVRVRFSSSGGLDAAMAAEETPGPSPEMIKIRELIQQQKWSEAREALQKLLLRTPADRTNLAQLAYVRAREALELGNLSEARRELVRALAIEPTLEPAKATLAEINSSPINSPVPRR